MNAGGVSIVSVPDVGPGAFRGDDGGVVMREVVVDHSRGADVVLWTPQQAAS